MNQEEDQWANPQVQQDPIVTSGESDEGVLEDSSDEDDENEGRLLLQQQQQANNAASDMLYDENADAEDEAYVYNYLRSGSAEQQKQQQQQQQQPPTKLKNHKKFVKPRNSDAVLSCPCCLSIVCMECQQHERYDNQYRAMFVMNIMVRWDLKLLYDQDTSQLLPYHEHNSNNSNNDSIIVVNDDDNRPSPPADGNVNNDGSASNNNGANNHPARVPDDDDHPPAPPRGTATANTAKAKNNNNKITATASEADDEAVLYYTVCCANCHTQVASLDMRDEVYHFYSCVASA